MVYKYITRGTCSKSITVELEDGIVKNVQFEGGCNGNTQGVSALVRGMNAQQVISTLKGIRCGFKNTSCPDQLATALEQALKKE
ncbi:MAG: TIGR03905 family TSCPD domain-containing protein [Clostridia bacterium]|nr:TIGR03905 family TSCPD domain-containing protein [Clostridia bacterium]